MKHFFSSFKTLQNSGILGMNRRNVEYIGAYNKRNFYPLVDDKFQTKQLATKNSIATPKLLLILCSQHDVKQLEASIKEFSSFVIKPARGSGGKGIMVIVQKDGELFVRANGEKISIDTLKRHVSNILAGLYSLSGTPDCALFEERIIADPFLEHYSYEGVPDIRIILFRGYPVMAMLRLSTKRSNGKANLHQGAVGVGIDIKTAKAVHAVLEDSHVKIHPDTKSELDKITIPNWYELLVLASSCYDITQLGYLGADIVIDSKQGPLLLELNARPGLSIQIANDAGLLPRLEQIKKIKEISKDPKERVKWVLQNLKS